jgi:D-alanyl-D-alanine carboxypeptidase (penicillin-binding protein 5/6)
MRSARLLVALCLVCAAARAAEPAPQGIDGVFLVKRDGRLLWTQQSDRRMAPASLAKMMSALLALERGKLDAIVTVGRSAASETGTRIQLRAGDRLRARDLLAAMLIRSANDACHALAEHISGSAERFVAAMNARARQLGLADTRFEDPCGHDRPNQYSTASDLARLAEAVTRFPEYLRLAEMVSLRIATTDGARSFKLETTNALLGRYEGAIGLKTGYTPGAGQCLVALAEKNGVRVLLVMLNAPNRWWDAVHLLDRAFAAG